MVYNNMVVQGNGFVIFLIDGKEYALNVKTLASIVNPLEVFPFNYSIDIGKDSLRIDNEEIPIIDMYDLLNIKAPPQSKDTRIIIINIEEQFAAFYVEKIKEFISTDIKNPFFLDPISVSNQSLIKGKIKHHGSWILVPDFEKILSQLILSKD